MDAQSAGRTSQARIAPRTEMWRGKDSNLRRRKPADLQSAPVGRLGTPPQNEPRILISGSWRVNACWPVICLGVGRREADRPGGAARSEEHTSELQSPCNLVCRLLLEKKKTIRSRAPPVARLSASW